MTARRTLLQLRPTITKILWCSRNVFELAGRFYPQTTRAAKYNQFVPSRLKRDIDFPTLRLEEHRGDFPGVD